MSDYIAHKNSAGWSVCNSEQILCFNVPRQTAVDAILAAGGDANALVDPAPPNQWWPTLLSALQRSTFNLQATVNTLAKTETVDAVQSAVVELSQVVQSVVDDLSASKKREALIREIAEVEADIESRLPKVRAQILGYVPSEADIQFSGYTLDVVRALMLRFSPIGAELLSLRKQLEQLQ
jgi:hypothetical protein